MLNSAQEMVTFDVAALQKKIVLTLADTTGLPDHMLYYCLYEFIVSGEKQTFTLEMHFFKIGKKVIRK